MKAYTALCSQWNIEGDILDAAIYADREGGPGALIEALDALSDALDEYGERTGQTAIEACRAAEDAVKNEWATI